MNVNMAEGGKPRTTAEHFKYEEEKALPVSKFFETYKDRFPMLAIITEGIYGLTRFDSYDCYQVIRVHCHTAQPRIICMTEYDATRGNYRYITIPVRTGLLYRIIQSRKNQSQPMTLEEILNKFALPLLVTIEPTEKQRMIKVGNSRCSVRNFGRFLLISQYEEKYLKQNCIDGDDLKMNPTSCMLSMNDENCVAPITGFKHRSKEEFDRYCKKLDKQASEHPEQYNKKDGNPDFAEHNLSEQAYSSGGASIPKSMKPAEAHKLIRTFHDEALPPLPPPPPLPTEGISTNSVLPPKRPPPLHGSASKGSVPQKQKTREDEDEDEDENADYEIPVDYRQECPKLPPRGSTKKQLSGSINDSQKANKLMAELKLKVSHDAKSKDKPGESDLKPPDRPAMKLPDTLKVHQQESSRKDGYENTKIERAVVRPQQVVTQENEYEISDSVYSVPEAEPDVREKPDTSGQSENLKEDMDYVEVREVHFPPTFTRKQEPKQSAQPKVTTPPVRQPRTRINPIEEQSYQRTTTSTGTEEVNGNNEERFTGVAHMTIAEVGKALKRLNLGHHVQAFQENRVDGEILSALSVDDFVNELTMKRLEAIRLEKFIKHGHIPQ